MATRLPNGRRLQVQCYGYSPVGHLLGLHDSRSGFTTYTYDPIGQLLQATTPTLSETFAFGRRVAKRVACPGQPERTTLFVWDGDTLLQEIDAQRTVTYVYEPQSFVPLARVQSTESLAHYPPDSVAIATVHDWAPPRLGDVSPDAPHDAHLGAWQHHLRWQQALRDEARAQAAYDTHSASAHAVDICHLYECDHLGTPQMLLDDQGRTAWSAHYRAWGRIDSLEVNDIDQPLRFQGQYEDPETGLYYNRHRYYDSAAGRYVSQDPIGLHGGNNLFANAPNSTEWIDPFGLARLKSAKTIRYSQSTYGTNFAEGGCVTELAHRLKNDPDYAKNIEPIRLIRFRDLPSDVQQSMLSQGASKDMVFSIDSRRLGAAKQANTKINTRWATKSKIEDFATLKRFSTKNAGKSACPK